MKNNMKHLWEFYNRLMDEESKTLFEVKMNQLRKPEAMIEYLADCGKEWNLLQYDEFREKSYGKKLIIRGAGVWGQLTYEILRSLNIDVFCFCDNDKEKQKNKVRGKEVISEEVLVSEYKDSYVLIASRVWGGQWYGQLLEKFFPRENIFLPRIGSIYATTGNQYFDCPEFVPGEEEIFIDCGCFDGETSKEFAKWCNNNYKRIIVFEPDKYVNSKIEENIGLDNVEVYPYAVGKERGQLQFTALANGGSEISADGEDTVIVESIDNILKGEKATFIKMDIEGAEVEAIRGAEKTIKKYKPKLAICIYHKPEDIIEIPELIMSMRDDYRFYIRHYTSCLWETVLYAI